MWLGRSERQKEGMEMHSEKGRTPGAVSHALTVEFGVDA